MFENFGPLSEVVLLRSKDEAALSKGSAFVKFQTKEAADLAIASMNQKVKDKVSAEAATNSLVSESVNDAQAYGCCCVMHVLRSECTRRDASALRSHAR